MKDATVLVAATMSLFISGCVSTLTRDGMMVRVTDGAGVKGCKFLDTLSSSSGWGASGGVDIAKIDVLNEAGDIGATHVVFTGMNPIFIASVEARAYRCEAGSAQRLSN